MSTLMWFPSTGTAPVSVTPDTATNWTLHDSGVRRELLFSNVGESALTEEAYTPDAVDHLVFGRALHSQYVSKVLQPQTLPSQRVSIVINAKEESAANNLCLRWTVYCVNEAGDTVLGVPVPVQTGDQVEFTTSRLGAADYLVSDAVVLTENWRLVLEIGASGTPTDTGSTNGHNFTLQTGEGDGGDDLARVSDSTSGPGHLMFATSFLTVSP
jgi:hypothetical protein